MKKTFALMCFLSGFNAASIQAETLQYELSREDRSKLTYYLTKSTNPSENLLVLIQGSDCNSIFYNKNINETFSRVLNNKDVLTVEKYGINKELKWSDESERSDCPQSYLNHDSPKQRVEDIKQILKQLLNEKNYDKLVVLGGSEGALVANMVAAIVPEIDQTVVINGGGRWFVDDVLHNIELTTPPEAFVSAKEGFLGFKQHILASGGSKAIVSNHGYSWWRDMFELDQSVYIEKIQGPLLIIQSGQDKNVSPKLAYDQAKSFMKTKKNLEYKVYPNLDHGFKSLDGEIKSDEVVRDIKRWLSQH